MNVFGNYYIDAFCEDCLIRASCLTHHHLVQCTLLHDGFMETYFDYIDDRYIVKFKELRRYNTSAKVREKVELGFCPICHNEECIIRWNLEQDPISTLTMRMYCEQCGTEYSYDNTGHFAAFRNVLHNPAEELLKGLESYDTFIPSEETVTHLKLSLFQFYAEDYYGIPSRRKFVPSSILKQYFPTGFKNDIYWYKRITFKLAYELYDMYQVERRRLIESKTNVVFKNMFHGDFR